MKKILVVSACYGLMVVSASAAERWPDSVCKEIGRMRGVVETTPSPVAKANQRFAILSMQENHCGISTRAEQEADEAILVRADKAAARPVAAPVVVAPAPRQPMNCLSVPMTGGAVATGCN